MSTETVRTIATIAGPLIQGMGGVPAGVVRLAEGFAADVAKGNYVGAVLRLANLTLGPAGQLLGLAFGVGQLRGALKDIGSELARMSRAPLIGTTWRVRPMMTLHVGVTQGGRDPEYGAPPRGHAWRGDKWIATRTSVGIAGPLLGLGLASVVDKRISLGFGVHVEISVPRFVTWHEQRRGEPLSYWDTPPEAVRL